MRPSNGNTIPTAKDGYPYYVYALVDPHDLSVFYVGKGKQNRHAAHIAEFLTGRFTNYDKHKRIAQVVSRGQRPIEIIIEEFADEASAYSAELAVIERIGFTKLTNSPKGTYARGPEADAKYAAFRLTTVIPFGLWMRRGRRSAFDIILYFRLKMHLWELASRVRVGTLAYEIKPRARTFKS